MPGGSGATAKRVGRTVIEQEKQILQDVGALRSLAPAGYAMAFHVHFTSARWLFQTYPPDWIAHYSRAGYVMSDPTVRWGFENVGTVRWADLLALDEGGVMADAARWGMRFGATVVVDSGGTRSITSFSRADRDLTDDELDRIAAIVNRLHRLTAEIPTLGAEAREKLRAEAIAFSQP